MTKNAKLWSNLKESDHEHERYKRFRDGRRNPRDRGAGVPDTQKTIAEMGRDSIQAIAKNGEGLH